MDQTFKISSIGSLDFSASPDLVQSDGYSDKTDLIAGMHPNADVFYRKSNQSIDASIEYIHANFDKKIKVEAIARAAFVSQYHFSRRFKKHTGFSPYQYLLRFRLQRARAMMLQDFLSIKEVCYRTGFTSIDYFSSAFTKMYSVCPSMYRKKSKLKN